MSIVSLDELTAYMGGGDTLTPAQKDLISDVIIPGLQQELERYLNNTVELVQVRESLSPESDGYVYFTYAPVRKIISAIWSQAGAQPISVTQYTPDHLVVDPSITRPVIDRTATSTNSDGYRYYVGLTGFPGLQIGWNQAYLVFDYIAGYDGTQDYGLKNSMLRVAAREVDHQFGVQGGLRSGNIDTVVANDVRVKGWQQDELKSLDRLRRRVIV